MIVIGCSNVYASDIESFIQCLDCVDWCCVVVIEDKLLGSAGVACVTLSADSTLSNADAARYIRASCARSLAAKQVPTRVLVLDKQPLLSNGKTDRRTLKRFVKNIVTSDYD